MIVTRWKNRVAISLHVVGQSDIVHLSIEKYVECKQVQTLPGYLKYANPAGLCYL